MSLIKQHAIETIKKQAAAIYHLIDVLTDDFEGAVEAILKSEGRVIVTGLGKSGHVGRKIAATLASTGTPAFFVHSTEACHGDLGMILPKDIVLAITNSGKTAEVVGLIEHLRGNVVISITSNPESTLAKLSNFHLNTGIQKEACPLNRAPTSSSTATLVMGDALAIALMKKRKFTDKDFLRFHPGGTLAETIKNDSKQIATC